MDIWVVRASDLAPLIERHVREHTEPRGGYDPAMYDPLMDLGRMIGISTRVLYAIRKGEREIVEWHLADRILSAIDRNDAARTMEIIPNPRMSERTFERRLTEALAPAA